MNIVTNRKALHDYFIEEKFEAGMVLKGFEVKAIRKGQVQLKDSYVKIIEGEVWLLGCHVSALISTSTHNVIEPDRKKKLLLTKKEIGKLFGKVQNKGYTIIALNLHYKDGKIKAEIALVKGKESHDKRATIKERELNRERELALKKYKRM